MSKRYDLVVLGGGAAGLVAAHVAARLGARVALVEAADEPGGDCLFTGCVPSKSLLASAKLAHDFRTADKLGLEPHEPRIDFARVMERIDAVIERVGRDDTAERLAAYGIEVVRGRGRFAGPGIVLAAGRELSYRAAVIATGSRPRVPAIPGLDRADALTNETVFQLREQPRELAVLGGGPVGVELAQAFARLGTSVDLVEATPRLLPGEEEEAGRFVGDTLAAEGIAIHTDAATTAVEPTGGGAGRLVVEGRPAIAYDRLLLALGRQAAGDGLGLGLETVGVELEPGGAVRVDDRMRTSGDRIYAAGDVTARLDFTHVAAYHGFVAALNALLRARQRVDHSAIPWVTFTDPEVARVGMSEAQARESLGAQPVVLRHDYAESDRALTAADARGFAKLVANRRGRLLGATIVAPAAGESIAEAARLVRDGGKVGDLSQMVHAYPTFTEGPARAADEWWTLRYLTPRTRRLMRPLLAVLRAIDRPRG